MKWECLVLLATRLCRVMFSWQLSQERCFSGGCLVKGRAMVAAAEAWGHMVFRKDIRTTQQTADGALALACPGGICWPSLMLVVTDDALVLVHLAFFPDLRLSWIHRKKHTREFLMVFRLPLWQTCADCMNLMVSSGLSSYCLFMFGALLVDWTADNTAWNHSRSPLFS
jgi:hypothetical protein